MLDQSEARNLGHLSGKLKCCVRPVCRPRPGARPGASNRQRATEHCEGEELGFRFHVRPSRALFQAEQWEESPATFLIGMVRIRSAMSNHLVCVSVTATQTHLPTIPDVIRPDWLYVLISNAPWSL